VATEQGWDLAQTLGSLARKAGLPVDAWRDPAARFEVFQTVHCGEEECP
jgi:AMMECR1 domain-containing protein